MDEVSSLDDLLQPLIAAGKPPERWRIGLEIEQFGILAARSAPLPYQGESSVQRVFELLMQRGWQGSREIPTGDIIALRRDDASVTLEPGGQVELSGSPLPSLTEIAAELHRFQTELQAIGQQLGILWLGLGFHPLAHPEELPWVPKLRYGIMRAYLPTRGSMALDMMQRTCTVQANLDYADEQDAMRKLRVALRLQPLATAMFANSPWAEGQPTGGLSRRGAVWLHMDPDRSGLLPFAWRPDASFRDYVEWALDVPMFMLRRGDHAIRNTAQTFRQFMQHGCQGERATSTDWQMHLNTLFPEVRLKGVLEMRGADSQQGPMVLALPALWQGLIYDRGALHEAETLTAAWTYAAVEALRPDAIRLGLQASLLGRPLREWAQDLVGIAERGLRNLAVDNGRDERSYLAPLQELVAEGETPAGRWLKKMGSAPMTAEDLVSTS